MNSRYVLLLLGPLLLLACDRRTPSGNKPEPETWKARMSAITWVAYSSPSANPEKRIEPDETAIREDLATLRKAGFTGLVTYGSSGIMGRDLPSLATSAGFEGLIVGVWDPTSRDELDAAKSAAKFPIVLGYCVGNEGYQKRYKLPELSAAIQELRTTTGKPVTTTEEFDDYSDQELLELGDWIFPNVHPYFHNKLIPEPAARWTEGAYLDLKRRSQRLIILKEVGLPTAGDNTLSESAQVQYYLALAKSDVRFVYFEAFDQPWKTSLPVEPHWGIFRSDRTPKRLASHLMKEPPVSQTKVDEPFYVYLDAGSPKNHFVPSGYMGDLKNIHINEAFEENPHSGKTCIRIQVDKFRFFTNRLTGARGWAGVYWQEPPNNWGKDEFWKGKGFDLSEYKRVLFWGRADKECSIEFKVGGIDERYGDSLSFPRSKLVDLDNEWREFVIDLSGADLRNIIGGFCWVTNNLTNPHGATFYLDDIRYER